MAERNIHPENPTFKIRDYSITYPPNWLQILYTKLGFELFDLTIVKMGNISDDPTFISHTLGAYPCLAGAAIEKNGNGIYIFHTFSVDLPKKLIELVNKGTIDGGIVGGRRETYNWDVFKKFFESVNIDYVPPLENSRQSFAVLSEPSTKSIFYTYDANN